jgi:hypothetical protein
VVLAVLVAFRSLKAGDKNTQMSRHIKRKIDLNFIKVPPRSHYFIIL